MTSNHQKNRKRLVFRAMLLIVAPLLLRVPSGFAGSIATPTFSVPTGRYNHPLTITLQCATPGARIYYTTDGTTPNENSLRYDGMPILVVNHASGDSLTGATDNDPVPDDSSRAITYWSMILKAVAIKEGMEASEVATAQYVLDLVDGFFNIPYADPPPADGGKHLLDIYQPHGRTHTPVLLFIHGGAWKQGDKSIYLELGNTFAGDYNVTTVIASYQLSTDPWNAKHPTHVKDVALAFAWVHDHIADFGGDSTNITVFGQSAGGHLVSLLATDSTYLDSLGQSIRSIKRVISMSGTYDIYDMVKWPLNPLNLTAQEVLEYKALCLNTFGSWDKAVLDAASPATFIHPNQPPFFLITLNQTNDFKDMPGFPIEAENFYNAVRALNGPPVHIDTLSEEDIPPEILGLDFPGDTDGHYQEIYAINTRYWDSRSTQLVAGYLDIVPEIPILAAPSPNASMPLTATMTWKRSRHSTYYHLQVTDATSLADPSLVFDGFVGDTTWTLRNLLPGKEYAWRVSGVSAAGQSAFSDAWTFRTGTAAVEQNGNSSAPQNWELSFYPNPFKGTLRIVLHAPRNAKGVKMSVFNLLGRLITEREITVHAEDNRFSWTPQKKLPGGVYIVRFDAGNLRLHRKVLYLK